MIKPFNAKLLIKDLWYMTLAVWCYVFFTVIIMAPIALLTWLILNLLS